MARAQGIIERKLARWGLLFVTPAVLFFTLFYFYPIINALQTSLTNRKVLSLAPPDFVGLKNYAYLLQSPDFWNSVRATAIFTVGTFLPLLIASLILAVLVVQIPRGKRFFQLAL